MSRLRLDLLLGDNLLKRSYSRLLVVGTALGVTAVIVGLTLFANYYSGVEETIMGVNPHVSLHKDPFSAGDLEAVEAALTGLGEEVLGWAPAIDVIANAVVTSVSPRSVSIRWRAPPGPAKDHGSPRAFAPGARASPICGSVASRSSTGRA